MRQNSGWDKVAIQNATNIRNEYLKNLAIANFAKELINLKSPEQTTYVDMVRNMKISEKHKDLQLLRNEILEKIKTQPNRVDGSVPK